ncbi:peptidase S8/S53 domain-containing protein [Colletotrichum navitas]|uniref:Peptidase S8/S53 domain-containing protein n=1 Tax=Colletotrichum navitas TaxID=681940 RepID=A0AAD8UYI3_9PEZI|nr:peptidase S8/S53 domain-containing protein [Colletotrichum navitas]KAK1569702.1 peptidase S8/S53 domain-containing protein [Colletotrichum navitas]
MYHGVGHFAHNYLWYTGLANFESQGSTDSATLIEAFLTAYDDGVGGSSGWAEEVWALVASILVEQGVVVTISAAKSGSQGPFYSSSGSSGKNVLAIASADVPTVETTRASAFTSWGLLNDLSVKPDVAAPGGSIYSAYIDNRWITMSGPSMSCPYVAGAAALCISALGGRQVHGKGFTSALIKQIIANARPLTYYQDGYTELANGCQIAIGDYTLRYAALRTFGNPLYSDNWATFTTPVEVLGQY